MVLGLTAWKWALLRSQASSWETDSGHLEIDDFHKHESFRILKFLHLCDMIQLPVRVAARHGKQQRNTEYQVNIGEGMKMNGKTHLESQLDGCGCWSCKRDMFARRRALTGDCICSITLTWSFWFQFHTNTATGFKALAFTLSISRAQVWHEHSMRQLRYNSFCFSYHIISCRMHSVKVYQTHLECGSITWWLFFVRL